MLNKGNRELWADRPSGAGRPQSHEHTELQGGQGRRGGELLIPGKVRQRTAGELLRSESKVVYPHMDSYSALTRQTVLLRAGPRMHLGDTALSELGPSQKDRRCVVALTGGTQSGLSTEPEGVRGPSG